MTDAVGYPGSKAAAGVTFDDSEKTFQNYSRPIATLADGITIGPVRVRSLAKQNLPSETGNRQRGIGMNDIESIIQALELNGPRFSGSDDAHTAELAEGWTDYFSAEEAIDWIDIGFWDSATAFLVRERGLQPGDVAGRINDCVTGYTVDEAIYAMCNDDLSVDALVD
jgi:hypothetical protein